MKSLLAWIARVEFFELRDFVKLLAVFPLALAMCGCGTRVIDSLNRIPGEGCLVGNYEIQIYRYPHDGGLVEIKRGENVVYSMHARKGGFYIGGETGDIDEMGHPSQIDPGADIFGNGKQNLILTRWAWERNGIDRNFTDYILEFSDSVKLVKQLKGGAFFFRKSEADESYIIYRESL